MLASNHSTQVTVFCKEDLSLDKVDQTINLIQVVSIKLGAALAIAVEDSKISIQYQAKLCKGPMQPLQQILVKLKCLKVRNISNLEKYSSPNRNTKKH